jgi:hypothetical protein
VNADFLGWHYVAIAIDDLTTKTLSLYTDQGNNTTAAWAGVISNASGFCLGTDGAGNAGAEQIAYCAVFNNLITSAMAATFWRHALASGLAGTTNTYARTNPLRTAISSAYVHGIGAGQVSVGYHPNFAITDGQALKTGELFDAGRSFLGINSANMPAWVGTNATVAAADGPSAMRDAARVADTDAGNAGYATSGTATLTGATNVDHTFGYLAKQGGVGATCHVTAYFTGDPDGAQELVVSDLAGTVPAAWTTYPQDDTCPTYYATVNPGAAGDAHTGVVLRMYPTDGVAASVGTVDFAETWGYQGSTPVLGWRATAAGAAQATTTPTESYTNVGNARYRPAKFRIVLRIAAFQGTAGATFFSAGATGAKGNVTVDYSGGQLRVRVYDNTPALVTTVNCGALDDADHQLTIRGSAAGGTVSVRDKVMATGVETEIGTAAPGAWVPSAVDTTPIYIGTDSAGANPARCLVAAEKILSF